MSKVVAAIGHSAESKSVLGMGRAVATALGASLEELDLSAEAGNEAEVGNEAEAGNESVPGGDRGPLQVLLQAAADSEVVAIVLGSRAGPDESGPPAELAILLAGKTDKPVVVVPSGFDPPVRLSTAVVAMEGTQSKARALQRNIALSTRAGLEIVVVHVDDEDSVPSFSDQAHYEAEAYAQEFFARHLIGAPQMRLELRIGSPADEVLSAVESAQAELVAIGWPQTDDPSRGRVAREIIDRSPVPVLLMALA